MKYRIVYMIPTYAAFHVEASSKAEAIVIAGSRNDHCEYFDDIDFEAGKSEILYAEEIEELA